MTTKHTGGPAFPTMRVNSIGEVVPDEEGLTVRDYFAAKALQALITTPAGVESSYEWRAIWAYRQADHMLEVRDK